MAQTGTASLTIAELREFASFDAAEQRYIKRSLDIGLGRQDAFKLWARDAAEQAAIRSQYVVYQDLKSLRGALQSETGQSETGPSETGPSESGPNETRPNEIDFMGTLLRISAFDLAQDRLRGFAAYRFLYERLLGAEFRPWLPAAFCGAATLPQIRPERRRVLLQSLSEAAATAPGWSSRAPSFYPEWVEKEAA